MYMLDRILYSNLFGLLFKRLELDHLSSFNAYFRYATEVAQVQTPGCDLGNNPGDLLGKRAQAPKQTERSIVPCYPTESKYKVGTCS